MHGAGTFSQTQQTSSRYHQSDLGLADQVDVNFQHPSDAVSDIKLAVFDMDSTIIQCEVIGG